MKCLLAVAAVFTAGVLLEAESQATPWTPAEFGGSLSVWLDGQDTASLTYANEGGVNRVTQWNDKSGNGNNVAAAGAQRPTLLTTGGVNGKQSLAFGGYAEEMNSVSALVGTPTGNSSYTLIAVYEYDSALGPDKEATHGYVATFGNTSANGIAGIDVKQPRFVHFSNDHFIIPAPTFTDGNAHFYVDHYAAGGTGGLNSLYFDGGTYGTANITTSLNLGANNLAINAFGNGALGGLGTHVGEVLLISDALSVEDRQLVEGYLAHKWFGAGALNPLPPDHPFKDAPPVVPEPSSFGLAAIGLVAVLRIRRGRREQ